MILGRYRVLAELGRGGMGIVHVAEMDGPGGFAKRVALKELRRELAKDDEHRQMFLEEARLGARLAHPNIVEVYDVGSQDDTWFMALELLDGASLGRARKLLGERLPLRLAVRVLSDVLGALQHAHALGIVHRDVSAENVFVTFDGRVKLLDFGVAKASDRSRTTREGIVKGSIQYMSPDHVAVEPIDGRADVFAIGVLLREILSGEKLWPEDLTDLAIVRRLLAKDVPAFPASALAKTSPVLRAICSQATRADRDERYATAREMKAALDAWLAVEDPRGSIAELGAILRDEIADGPISLPSSALVTLASTRIEIPRRRRKRNIAALGVALAVFTLAAIVVWPTAPEAAASRPSPRVEQPMLVRLDAAKRPLAPPPPAKTFDRFDPGY
jgi:eukaryotic-like serine/threonine-protein kinase